MSPVDLDFFFAIASCVALSYMMFDTFHYRWVSGATWAASVSSFEHIKERSFDQNNEDLEK